MTVLKVGNYCDLDKVSYREFLNQIHFFKHVKIEFARNDNSLGLVYNHKSTPKKGTAPAKTLKSN